MHVSLLGGVFCAAFILTIALAPFATPIVIGVLAIMAVVLTCWVSLHQTWRTGVYAGIAFSIGMTCALAAWLHVLHVPSPATLDWYNGSTVTFEGMVRTVPEERPSSVRITVDASAPLSGGAQIDLRITGDDFAYGDIVRVSGLLESPSDGYDAYLATQGIRTVVRYPAIEVIRRDEGNPVMRSLLSMKVFVERRVMQLLPEPQSAFLIGLLTGSRTAMPDDVLDDFRRTGLTHTIAISGYNITIVLALIDGALFWLPRRWRLLPSVAAIAAFTLFVGASASVMRAAIMGIIGIGAVHAGHVKHTRLAVLWAAVAMLAWNPLLLADDAGFQLSFLSVIGMMELSPLLARIDAWLPDRFGIRETLRATIAAQLTAAPWAAALFGNLSLISPIANLAIAMFLPVSMLLGALAVLTSILSMTAGLVLAYGAWTSLTVVLAVSHRLAAVPWSAVAWQPPLWSIGCAFALLAFGINVLQRKR